MLTAELNCESFRDRPCTSASGEVRTSFLLKSARISSSKTGGTLRRKYFRKRTASRSARNRWKIDLSKMMLGPMIISSFRRQRPNYYNCVHPTYATCRKSPSASATRGQDVPVLRGGIALHSRTWQRCHSPTLG